MPRNGNNLSLSLNDSDSKTLAPDRERLRQESGKPALVWDWDIEHEDRRRERKDDASFKGSAPFEVDRRVLRDVVREKMGIDVGRIKFLSAGMSQPGSCIAFTRLDAKVPIFVPSLQGPFTRYSSIIEKGVSMC
jgi:hypothetical protein